MKSRDLAGINEFDEYNSNSLRLDKAYKEIKNIQSDSASSVEEERKLVSMYEAVLMDNSRIYNSLRAQNLI